MPRFADDFVFELKERVDLYTLVSSYVQLKKSGSSWVGLSPFNQEKTPSFYIHPQKGFFNCFSSGEKGDAITFVQKIENLDFHEAVEFLAGKFGITTRYAEGNKVPRFKKSLRKEFSKRRSSQFEVRVGEQRDFSRFITVLSATSTKSVEAVFVKF